jgi:hypothetical protein
MKKLLLTLMVLVLALMGPATAQNMTISDMGFSGPQTIQVYAVNATSGAVILLGTYNTSTNGIPLPTGDFSLLFKPESSDYLRNPSTLLTASFGFVETNFIAILFIFTILGSLAWLGRK